MVLVLVRRRTKDTGRHDGGHRQNTYSTLKYAPVNRIPYLELTLILLD